MGQVPSLIDQNLAILGALFNDAVPCGARLKTSVLALEILGELGQVLRGYTCVVSYVVSGGEIRSDSDAYFSEEVDTCLGLRPHVAGGQSVILRFLSNSAWIDQTICVASASLL